MILTRQKNKKSLCPFMLFLPKAYYLDKCALIVSTNVEKCVWIL